MHAGTVSHETIYQFVYDGEGRRITPVDYWADLILPYPLTLARHPDSAAIGGSYCHWKQAQ